MKKMIAVVLFVFPILCQAQKPQLFQAKESGTLMACTDRSILPEAHDLALHDPRNPYLLELAQQGGCSPVLATFTVIKRVTLSVPAGPQAVVQIAIPDADNPSIVAETPWMMASDIERVH